LLRGSADLPAAINRGLQPIRRSLSFSKDLHRSHESLKQPYRTSSVQWYNSLSSLAEDEHADEMIDTSRRVANATDEEEEEEEVFDGRVQVTRTRSLVEKNPVRIVPFPFLFPPPAAEILEHQRGRVSLNGDDLELTPSPRNFSLSSPVELPRETRGDLSPENDGGKDAKGQSRAY